MPDTPVCPQSWFVVRTHPRQEFRAEQNLAGGGIEVFLPRIAARRRSGRSDAAPLFPQYLFAAFEPTARLHDVLFTRGVQSLLRVGLDLATVDDAAVSFLRGRVGEDGLIRVGSPLKPGERVQIEEGPFAAFAGVVERVIPERERVIILVTAVRASLRLDLDTHAVRRLPQFA